MNSANINHYPYVNTTSVSISGLLPPSDYYVDSTDNSSISDNDELVSDLVDRVGKLERSFDFFKRNVLNCVVSYKGFLIVLEESSGSYSIYDSDLDLKSKFHESNEACIECIDELLNK